jgi:hypothetical protein
MVRKSLSIAATLIALSTAAYAEDARQVNDAFADKWVKNYNANLPEGIAGMFTTEGVFIGPPGALKGRPSIERALAARIKAGWTSEALKVNEAHPVGDAVWGIGEFQFTGAGEQAGKQQSGHFGWLLVKEGSDWHATMVVAAPSAAPPPPK